WLPDKTLAKTCADFSDLEIGPDGCLYLLSDKSCTIARLDDLPAGGGTAALLDAWRLGDLDGQPEGLAFTAQGRAIVGLDTRKPRRNLVLLGCRYAGRGRPLTRSGYSSFTTSYIGRRAKLVLGCVQNCPPIRPK